MTHRAVAELIVILALHGAVQVQKLPSHSVCLTFYELSQDSASISIKYALKVDPLGGSQAAVASVIRTTKGPFTHGAVHSKCSSSFTVQESDPVSRNLHHVTSPGQHSIITGVLLVKNGFINERMRIKGMNY